MGMHFGMRSISPKEGEYPFSTFVHIELNGYTLDSANKILLSAQLMTTKEVDECIDGLIAELNKLRGPAKQHLLRIKSNETR